MGGLYRGRCWLHRHLHSPQQPLPWGGCWLRGRLLGQRHLPQVAKELGHSTSWGLLRLLVSLHGHCLLHGALHDRQGGRVERSPCGGQDQGTMRSAARDQGRAAYGGAWGWGGARAHLAGDLRERSLRLVGPGASLGR